jgi:hypothetical protein
LFLRWEVHTIGIVGCCDCCRWVHIVGGDIGGELTLFSGGKLEDLVLEAWVGSILGGIGITLSWSGIVVGWDVDVTCDASLLGSCANNGRIGEGKMSLIK